MAGTWYALRTDFRRRWLSYVVLTVLLAAGGGAALASVAGARRTISAYPRYLHASNASDVSLDAPRLGEPAVRERLVAVNPVFATVQVLPIRGCTDVSGPAAGELAGQGFAPAVPDYYLTNAITRASETMAECSRLYTHVPTLQAAE